LFRGRRYRQIVTAMVGHLATPTPVFLQNAEMTRLAGALSQNIHSKGS
jgi:hypothetical protein